MSAQDYLGCLKQALSDRGFKRIKLKELSDEYKRYVSINQRQGMNEAEANAAAALELQKTMELVHWARIRATNKNISVMAEGEVRLNKALNTKDIRGSVGFKISRGLLSIFADEKRVNGMNALRLYEVFRGRYKNMMSDVMEKFSIHKGFMGRQIGKAHEDNIVDEAFGTATHNPAAKEFVKAFEQMQDAGIADTNRFGGMIRKLKNWGLPSPSHPDTLTGLIKKEGGLGAKVRTAWVDHHLTALDWDKTIWPDGSIIPEGKRQAVLEHVFDTLTSGGMAHYEPKLGVQGRALGNLMNSNRFLFYKDAAAWRSTHALYGKGTSVFDVIMNHADKVAWRNATLKMLGPNPNAMAQTLEKMALAKAFKEGGALGLREAEDRLKNYVRPLMRHALRQDVQNPNTLSRNVSTASNVLYGSLLGSTSIISMTTDPMIAIGNRLSQSTGIKGLVTGWLGALFKPGGKTAAMQDALRVGFQLDEYISDNAMNAKYILGHGYGESIGKTYASAVFAVSGLNRHTTILRYADMRSMLFHLRDQMDKPLSDVPSRAVFEQYGISASDWDTIRKGAQTVSPRGGVEMFDPISILDIKHANAHDMYYKMQSMIQGENASSVIMGSPEARVGLGATLTAPTTIPQAVAASFGQLKAFPMDMVTRFGRIALTLGGGRRTAMIGGMLVGLTFAGALAKQLNNLTRGRELEDMSRPDFWIGAGIAGGGLGILGNFISDGLSADPKRNLLADLSGPMVGAFADAFAITGLPAKWGLVSDTVQSGTWAGVMRKTADWFENYATPKPWWARLVIEREFWDRIDEMLDPVGTQKARQLAVNRWNSQHKSKYFWPPAGATQ